MTTAENARWRGRSVGTAQGGFTLLELLVVIAIIGILGSLLLSAMSRAKHSAHSAVCRSNLRQWGMATQMYLNDFRVYPGYKYHWGLKYYGWQAQLSVYSGSKWPTVNMVTGVYQGDPKKGVAVCPCYAHLQGGSDDGQWADPLACGSYGYNWSGFYSMTAAKDFLGLGLRKGEAIDPEPRLFIGESEIVNPSDMIAISDATLFSTGGLLAAGEPIGGRMGLWPEGEYRDVAELAELGYTYWDQRSDLAAARAAIRARHSARYNMVFCDGHVENLRIKSLFDVRNPEVMKRWNRDNLPHLESMPLLRP